MPNDLKNYKSLLQLALVFCLPVFLFIIIGFLSLTDFVLFAKEIIAFSSLGLALYLVALLCNRQKLRLLVLNVFSVFLYAILFVKLSFFVLFKSMINASAFYIIFETNQTETLDFLNYYVDYRIILLLVVLFTGFIIGLKWLKKLSSPFVKTNTYTTVLCVFGIVVSTGLIYKKFRNQDVILISYKAIKDYSEMKAQRSSELSQPYNLNIKTNKTTEEAKTIVVVIGESTTKQHMSLYNYYRNTNPLLSSIRNELLVFNDVISANVHTIEALDKALTLRDKAHRNPINNTSVIQLANQAGFETYWLSNQKPLGVNETSITLIAKAAKFKHFLTTHDSYNEIYDEALLPALDEVLKNKAKAKLIFIHLMGTHAAYNKRFPSYFQSFDIAPLSKFNLTERAKNRINDYDTAVKYNDSIVYSIIEKVRIRQNNSAVLYFSDHGEDVYDTSDIFLGHNEYFGTTPMYEVPFLFWQSKEYKESHQSFKLISKIEGRPYILEDFIHTFMDMTNINSSIYLPERSIFNSEFRPKQRIVKSNTNYDETR